MRGFRIFIPDPHGPQVMKLVACRHDTTNGTHVGPEVAAECAWCGRLSRSPVCSSCHRLALRCAVCALGVRGLACACVYCGHAGHAHHMLKWYVTLKSQRSIDLLFYYDSYNIVADFLVFMELVIFSFTVCFLIFLNVNYFQATNTQT